jgi:hypothetical protein
MSRFMLDLVAGLDGKALDKEIARRLARPKYPAG